MSTVRLLRWLRQAALLAAFRDSGQYWEQRYRLAGDSGEGSKDHLARFKADFLNAFVATNAIASVIEFGCGDGRQLALASYPGYTGLDVSPTALRWNIDRFCDDPSKSFLLYRPDAYSNMGRALRADLALSLDVIYHLVENDIYKKYLRDLFSAARRYVVIYSSNADLAKQRRHIRHRRFADDVAMSFPEFRLVEEVANPYPDQTPCKFFVYERIDGRGDDS